MAENNENNRYTNSADEEISTPNYVSPDSALPPQAVFVTFNNQYNMSENSPSSYVLPVTILNNDNNYIFYNNSIGTDLDQVQKNEGVPQYIVNLDGGGNSNKTTSSASNASINTITLQNIDRLQELYTRFPLLNKLLVKRIYTRNLLSIDRALHELDLLHRVEEEKRRNIRLVYKQPKKEIKSVKRIDGDENLKSNIYANKPFERINPTLFKKVMVHDDNIVDCSSDDDNEIIEEFVKSRCKAFVTDEVNGVVAEDPKGCKPKLETGSFKLKVDKITPGPEAGSVFPWRNKDKSASPHDREAGYSDLYDLDADTSISKDQADLKYPPTSQDVSESSDTGKMKNEARVESVYPWRNKFPEKSASHKQSEYLPEIQVSKVQLEEIAVVYSDCQQMVELRTPNKNCQIMPKAKYENTVEPKFFRTKKLGDLELKKRTYVTKELNQLKAEKKTGMLSIPEYQNQRKRRKTKDKSDVPCKKANRDDEHSEEEEVTRGIASIIRNKVKESIQTLTKEERNNLLEFFNQSTQNELSIMPGLSQIKAEIVISLRPYTSLNDLIMKLKTSTNLSDSIVDSCHDVLNMRSMLTKLLQKCEKIKIRIEKVITRYLQSNQIQLPIDNAESKALILEVPQCLNQTSKLVSYQMLGINWLNLLHKEKLNGILADEMGLGKTVQAIAFLAHLYDTGERGPHLIIVPSSTITSWERELQYWCPSMNVIVYHGSQDERKQIRLKIYEGKELNFNILLTTYNISTGTMEDRAMMKRVNFHYGVFDEAHMLKNMLSNRYKNLVNFKVRRRLLLTGTPLQNNLLELISLLSFVMPDLFLPHTDFLRKIFQISNRKDDETGNSTYISEFDNNKIFQTKELLKPFCLRRLKEQVLSQLPVKSTDEVFLPLTECQQTFYKNVLNEIRQNSQSPDKSNQSYLSVFMNLRKISNHPLLLRNYYSEETLHSISTDLLQDKGHSNVNPETIFEDLVSMNDFQIHITCQLYSHVIGKYSLDNQLLLQSNKFQFLDQHLPTIIGEGHRILIFSQFTMMLDVLEAYLNLNKYSYLRLDGQTPVSDRQSLIDNFNKDDSIKIFILSKKAGGLGISLIGANVVIIHDVDFNPFVDRQAEDRCHRLGQTKNVRIIKLISKDTIEEQVFTVAKNKLKLDASTCGLDRFTDDSVDVDDVLDSSPIKSKVKTKKVQFQVGETKPCQNNDDSLDVDHTSLNDIEQLIKNSLV